MANTFALADQAVAERLTAALGERYRLADVLGRGGFGVVFAAEEPALGRAVAIKVLRPELAAPIIRERFRREATSRMGRNISALPW
jgi:serine/threonine-protein kinase